MAGMLFSPSWYRRGLEAAIARPCGDPQAQLPRRDLVRIAGPFVGPLAPADAGGLCLPGIDGRKTECPEPWDLCNEHSGTDAPTQDDVVSSSASFMPPDALIATCRRIRASSSAASSASGGRHGARGCGRRSPSRSRCLTRPLPGAHTFSFVRYSAGLTLIWLSLVTAGLVLAGSTGRRCPTT